MKTSRLHKAILGILFSFSFAIPALIGWNLIPIGEGPDELSHIDYSFFRFLRPDQTIDVSRGLIRPGKAPLGQGHQPHLYYDLNALLLSFFIYPQEIGSFIDYQAGLSYSSEGIGFGGSSSCAHREDPNRDDYQSLRLRNSIKYLRVLSAFFFALGVLASYLVGRLIFGPPLGLAMAFFHAAIPTAIWRSALVSNDNGVALFGSLAFLIGAYLIQTKRPILVCLLAAALAGLTFISKYTGIAAIGMVGLAILLRPSTGIVKRGVLALLCGGIFAAIIASDINENIAVDKDFLSRNVVMRVAAPLHSSSSLLELISDPTFTQTVISRFWLNFHNMGGLGPRFPLWTVHIWWLILAVALFGYFVRKNSETSPGRYLLYSLLSIVGSFTVILFIARSYPLPAARYIHYCIPAVGVLLIFGWYRFLLLFLSKRYATLLCTSFFGALWVFGNTISTGYAWVHFDKCKQRTKYSVEAGTHAFAADLNGDGWDEIGFYHRARNRLFFAEQSSAGFETQPGWTRTVGLVADKIHSGDVDADGKDEVIFWRPGSAELHIASGFLEHDASVSPFIDRSAKFYSHKFKEHRGDDLFIADANKDGKADACFYSRGKGVWNVYSITQGQKELLGAFETAASGEPFVLESPDDLFLTSVGIQSMSGESLHSQKTLSMRIERPKHGKLFAADLDGNGYDDLLSREKGEVCFRWWQPLEKRAHRGAEVICLNERTQKDFFWDYRNVFRVKREPPLGDSLASFDKRTGLVELTYFRVIEADFHRRRSVERSENLYFDAGFYSDRNRAALFDHWKR